MVPGRLRTVPRKDLQKRFGLLTDGVCSRTLGDVAERVSATLSLPSVPFKVDNSNLRHILTVPESKSVRQTRREAQRWLNQQCRQERYDTVSKGHHARTKVAFVSRWVDRNDGGRQPRL